MNQELSQKKIESEFSCQRCNACCRQPGFVYLKEGEAERIAAYLKMTLYDFTDQYCEVIDRRRLVLKKLPDEICVFLAPFQSSNDDKPFEEGGCRIHAVKPEQCRDFPYRWHTSESFEYCMGLRTITPTVLPGSRRAH